VEVSSVIENSMLLEPSVRTNITSLQTVENSDLMTDASTPDWRLYLPLQDDREFVYRFGTAPCPPMIGSGTSPPDTIAELTIFNFSSLIRLDFPHLERMFPEILLWGLTISPGIAGPAE
jgi:hypothetical protein